MTPTLLDVLWRMLFCQFSSSLVAEEISNDFSSLSSKRVDNLCEVSQHFQKTYVIPFLCSHVFHPSPPSQILLHNKYCRMIDWVILVFVDHSWMWSISHVAGKCECSFFTNAAVESLLLSPATPPRLCQRDPRLCPHLCQHYKRSLVLNRQASYGSEIFAL